MDRLRDRAMRRSRKSTQLAACRRYPRDLLKFANSVYLRSPPWALPTLLGSATFFAIARCRS